MTLQPSPITEREYLHQFESLIACETDSPLPCGLILEEEKSAPISHYASTLLDPLYCLNLFPFQDSNHLYLELSCAAWSDLEQLPHKIARSCILSGGLSSRFYGGLLLDLRWCNGSPEPEQLTDLERFLFCMRSSLFPILLTAPGTGDAITEQLKTLTLQRILTEAAPHSNEHKRLIGFERDL